MSVQWKPVFFRGEIFPFSQGLAQVANGRYQIQPRQFVNDDGDYVSEIWVPTDEYTTIEQSDHRMLSMRIYVRQE